MDKPTTKLSSWNSLRNFVLGVAVVVGAMAGLATKWCIEAPRTAHWRLERYEASMTTGSGSTFDADRAIGATATAVQ